MKTNTIRKGLLLLFLLLAHCGGGLMAQTFYEVQYTDKQGYDNYGLMLYTDEENCTLYLRRHTTDGNDFTFRQLAYVSESNDKDEEDYLVMACEEDNTPIFIWLWDKEESEEQQLVPYVTLDEDEEPEDWLRAKSFVEAGLQALAPEYLEQFIDPASDLFKQIIEARNEAMEGEKTADTERQAAIANLGDGTGIHNYILAAANEAEIQEAEKQNPQTGNAGAAASGNKQSGQTNGDVKQSAAGSTCNVSDRPMMHLFIVANTEVADIGQACRVDYNNIRNEMKGIAQSIGIRVKEYDVTGAGYSKEGLQQQISSLRPSANDIVVFLYTGHGFRFDDQKDPYPMMALTNNDYQPLEGNYVALSDVYNAICKKGARLNIVLSDCCNSKLGERRPLEGNTLFSRGNNNFSRKRLTELFFNAKGSLLSTAASPGEYSWCDAAGGMFTLSFIQSLRREISAMSTGAVSWQSVVDNTLKNALQRSSNNAEAQNGLKKVAVSF
ncbi:caspase family protein [Bacteroides helcogenes]|uniref:Peptidase C14 caspase catalytic subunit p20 n=1 Tax=Bacteroides helcogenes (strain ATCC 35417 / DSM 20613 / JCM 6297 / CCUG 15421 / P 36-108) TaxID=693979 RepID=E6SNB7_BACT6|nr:caspase family protein [Bacteroides helcogenes]ADV42710.1 peptidase C14 caspase catalytic subunit p20 [Bacteroides helcogenes P 36-108]MDY5239541.1 caspase family protein [Bacteroides helcogenes]